MGGTTVLYGRDRECAALTAAPDPGAGRLVVVVGAAGTGKSALLDAAARRLTDDGLLVLRCSGGAVTTGTDPEFRNSGAASAGQGLPPSYGDTVTSGAATSAGQHLAPGSGDAVLSGADLVLAAARIHFDGFGDGRVAALLDGLARHRADPDAGAGTDRVARLLADLGRRSPVALVVDDVDAVAAPAALLRAARRPGCLVLAACSDAGADEVTAVADAVVRLGPLPDDAATSVAARAAGIPLDESALAALRLALGPLFAHPGTLRATIVALRESNRLVAVGGRMCLRRPDEPVAVPDDHPLLAAVRSLGAPAPTLLAAVTALDPDPADPGHPLGDLAELGSPTAWDLLPELAAVAGLDVDRCGSLLDRMVESGVLVVGAGDRLSCRCPGLATAARQARPAAVHRLHALVARRLMADLRSGRHVDSVVLADHLTAAGADAAATRGAGHWLADLVAEAGPQETDRAVRWCAAAVRLLATTTHRPPRRPTWRRRPAGQRSGARRPAAADRLAALLRGVHRRRRTTLLGPLSTLLRLVVGTGRYGLLIDTLAALGDGWRWPAALRADLAVATALAESHTGRSAGPAPSWPYAGAVGRWHGAAPTLLTADELCRIERAVSGGERSADGDDVRLSAAGRAGDLATVFEMVLGRRYRMPAGGVLGAYRRLLRGYADGDWSAALSAAREMELTGTGDTPAHAAARLFAAEICAARGNVRRATAWLAAGTGDDRLTALRGWVECGLRYATGDAPGALALAERIGRHTDSVPASFGLSWLLGRAAQIAVAVDDRPAAARLRGDVAQWYRREPSRFRRAWDLVRGLVDGDAAAANAAIAAARRRGHRPELFAACRAAAVTVTDPCPPLHEAYAIARECGSPVLREQIRAMLLAHGLPAPRARANREPFSDIELRVVDLVSRGATNRRIGTLLQVSEKTVETHISRLLARTGCRSRVELAAAHVGGRLVARPLSQHRTAS